MGQLYRSRNVFQAFFWAHTLEGLPDALASTRELRRWHTRWDSTESKSYVRWIWRAFARLEHHISNEIPTIFSGNQEQYVHRFLAESS